MTTRPLRIPKYIKISGYHSICGAVGKPEMRPLRLKTMSSFLTYDLFPGIILVTVASYLETEGRRKHANLPYEEENSLARANEETIGQTRLGLSEWVELECR